MNGRTAVALAIAAYAAACSLFVDTGEFTSGDAVNDGGTTADATVEAAASTDAESHADAPSADAEVGRGCPDGGFCDSFERASVAGEWEDEVVAGGCALSIDSTVKNGGASSLKNVVAASAGDGTCEAYLFRGFVGSPRWHHLSFSMRFSAVPQRALHVPGLTFVDTERALFFMLRPDGLRLAEQDLGPSNAFKDYTVADFTSVLPMTAGAFHRVVLDHEVATRRTVVAIDGVKTLDGLTDLSFVGGDVDVSVGNGYTRAGPALELWFDDFEYWPEY